ncbi:alpha-amylase family protein [Xanthocytophaga agilis]|uniref:Family 10 glycosylhydrolase n=1 Tax=Xanthocytophaga agilis TaxID=3048010 RepID=A0AAE3UJY5_9BACT|nr:family 10 glycosylhydrolase [Xanthocytophaga agilis]MDJ1505938.1 family 10 glycosylhydrolase [Xanthocytophaga agilis]
MKESNLYILVLLFFICISCTLPKAHTSIFQPTNIQWPDTLPWWKANNLRVIQTNLPDYEAGLNTDSLLSALTCFSANTLLINAGGIMAFYPTKLPFHYTNPYMKENMLGDVITKCHRAGIRVIVRFDFSRAHESIYKAHPDWFYISSKGERMINNNMYVISINAPYEQECLFKIVEEVMTLYPIDGIFINMPGYQTRNSYINKYYGIDQNDYDKQRFAKFSGGMTLPVTEDKNDPVFQKYEEFKKFTADEIIQRLHTLVKSKNKQIAICTYSDKYVDIIRHESQATSSIPYWPYTASDNVSNARNSFPDHIISNASIQQISFQSRYNAIEPEEVAIRLYENIANGSGLDISLMGDFQNYEDERNYDIIKEVYAFHKKHEPYFGNYTSPAQVAIVAPGAWPSGEPAQEYRGIQLMLKEAHIQYDILEDAQVGELEASLQKYRILILPDIIHLNEKSLAAITKACQQGMHLIATNRSLTDHPKTLESVFGVTPVTNYPDGSGYYLAPDNKQLFKHFDQQKMLFWKFNLGLYTMAKADSVFLPILTPGRPGPPEIIGGHQPSGYHAMAVKKHPVSKAVILPINLGRLYYLHGYEQHKNILLDVIDYLFPEVNQLVQTNAHPRIETILQKFRKNLPENLTRQAEDGYILHLVNLTGFSGNTYFTPLTVYGLTFKVKTDFKPNSLFLLSSRKAIPFTWNNGFVTFTLDRMEQFSSVILEK